MAERAHAPDWLFALTATPTLACTEPVSTAAAHVAAADAIFPAHVCRHEERIARAQWADGVRSSSDLQAALRRTDACNGDLPHARTILASPVDRRVPGPPATRMRCSLRSMRGGKGGFDRSAKARGDVCQTTIVPMHA
jgi:hypothetical protein